MATASKSRLGRGLGNLIAGGASATKAKKVAKKAKQQASVDSVQVIKREEEGAYREVLVAKVQANPFQPRKDFAEEQIEELAESIRAEGLLQPVVVRKKNGGFELIAGERRLRACKSIGLKKIPVRIVESSDVSSAALALIENIQREDLNPIDEAFGLASLVQDFKLTQEAVAERLGKSRSAIANMLRLLQLGEEIQGYLAKGLISTGHAKVILGLEGADERLAFARRIIEGEMSVREAEKVLKALKKTKNDKAETQQSQAQKAVITNLQKEITSYFHTKVTLQHGAKKGKLVIEYAGNEELKRILDKMGVHS